MMDLVEIRDEVICVGMMPPRQSVVQIGLYHVRAADDIQIAYDFDRDGWVVKRCRYHDDDDDDTFPNGEEWVEVFFTTAWPFGPPNHKGE